MSEMLQSARWQLPLLAVGQSQKEVTHNEALVLIDALIAPVAVASGVNDPPSAPITGQIWLAGTAPTGVWTGFAMHLACWTSGGWRMIAPRSGMTVRLESGSVMRFDGTAWLNPGQPVSPAGGAVVDIEARAAISVLIEALQAHGWLEQN
jgi:Protein of unknown function (DUF2793)